MWWPHCTHLHPLPVVTDSLQHNSAFDDLQTAVNGFAAFTVAVSSIYDTVLSSVEFVCIIFNKLGNKRSVTILACSLTYLFKKDPNNNKCSILKEFVLQRAMNAQSGSRGISLLFL